LPVTAQHTSRPGHLAAEMVELPREECLRLLAAHRFGRLALNGTDGVPIIRPVNYAFDAESQSIVFRTAEGSKFHRLVDSSHAAFEIDGIDTTARTGWSVVVRGVAGVIENPNELSWLDRLGLEPWVPGDAPRWVRIRAVNVSGRRIVPRTGTPCANG
jgi:uncharacterized protein